MALLTLEATGSRGEELSMAAGDAIGVAVGFDPEFDSATYDSDEHATEAELKAAVFAALDALDSDWREHLSVAE
jgi:hypothetical protein